MTFPFDIALVWLDLAGIFFFAVSGSLLAARKRFDILGSLLLASLVSLGGGVIRDIILNTVPAAFTNPAYLVPPLLATVLVYFLYSSVQRFTSLLVLFDAGGLALFCITGTLKAISLGMNPLRQSCWASQLRWAAGCCAISLPTRCRSCLMPGICMRCRPSAGQPLPPCCG
jgi:uncharacterized membrane protein YeiH